MFAHKQDTQARHSQQRNARTPTPLPIQAARMLQAGLRDHRRRYTGNSRSATPGVQRCCTRFPTALRHATPLTGPRCTPTRRHTSCLRRVPPRKTCGGVSTTHSAPSISAWTPWPRPTRVCVWLSRVSVRDGSSTFLDVCVYRLCIPPLLCGSPDSPRDLCATDGTDVCFLRPSYRDDD